MAHGLEQVDGRVEASADVVPLGVHVELVGNLDAEVLVLFYPR